MYTGSFFSFFFLTAIFTEETLTFSDIPPPLFFFVNGMEWKVGWFFGGVGVRIAVLRGEGERERGKGGKLVVII